MSWMPGIDPEIDVENCPDAVEMVIIPRSSDLGGFDVKRALPFRTKRLVGPFIFWDQMGPGEFLTGQGIDVRPHPHIGLSTVTYLLDGSLVHRDSLGSNVTIQPGEINLMSAGGGIAHSERTAPGVRTGPSRLFGIQSWVAQPITHESGPSAFNNYGADAIPTLSAEGISARVLMGAFHGVTSPVRCDWDTLYADVRLTAGSRLPIPRDTEERAIYVTSGIVEIGSVSYEPERMLVLCPGRDLALTALTDVRLMLLGGAVMDGPRFIWWNFVASSQETIEAAKEKWRQRAFPEIPDDNREFVPLPER